jgi:hypothetical protein
LSRVFFLVWVAVASCVVADVSRSVPEMVDDFTELFEWQDGAEVRLRLALASAHAARDDLDAT